MTRKVLFLPEAEHDVTLARAYILVDNPAAADRFVTAVVETALGLVRFPQRGRLVEVDQAHLRPIRFLMVRRFRKYNLYYRVLPGTIEVIRVLHSARDTLSIVARE